jgi:hypothetical protein
MHMFHISLVLSYLLVTCYFFSNWLRFCFRHPCSSPEDKFLSFVMFVLTTVFWPVLVPFSCLEMYKTGKIEFSNVVPVIVAVSAFSCALYFG